MGTRYHDLIDLAPGLVQCKACKITKPTGKRAAEIKAWSGCPGELAEGEAPPKMVTSAAVSITMPKRPEGERPAVARLIFGGPLTFAEMLCPNRGEVVGTVPCGKCGGKDRPIAVALCSLPGVVICSEESTARTAKQLVPIDGGSLYPTNCQTCPVWVGTPERPRKVRRRKEKRPVEGEKPIE